MSEQQEPPQESVTEIEVDHAAATAFMMYVDMSSVPGVFAVLRSRQDWGYLLKWSYMDGTEVAVKLIQRKPKKIIH